MVFYKTQSLDNISFLYLQHKIVSRWQLNFAICNPFYEEKTLNDTRCVYATKED